MLNKIRLGGFEGYLILRMIYYFWNFDLLYVCGLEFMLKINLVYLVVYIYSGFLYVCFLVNYWSERKLIIVKL